MSSTPSREPTVVAVPGRGRLRHRCRRPVAALALILAVCLLATVLLPAPTARGQIPVTDILHTAKTVVHYITRLVEVAQKYVQIYNQVRQLYNQLQQIDYQLQALKKLDRYWLRNVAGTIDSMERVLGGGSLPSHMSPAVRHAFADAYRGWQLPEDWWEEERAASLTTLATLRETLWAKHLQHRTAREQLDTLAEIKAQVAGIEGHQEALEAIASINAFHAEALVLSQMAQLTSGDAATAYYAYETNRVARQERAIREALRRAEADGNEGGPVPRSSKGGRSQGHRPGADGEPASERGPP